MVTSLVASLVLLATHTGDKLVCPVMGGAAHTALPSLEYAGAKYWFCCGGCDADFKKEPAKFLKTIAEEGSTSGLFLFDPVSRDRLDVDKAKGGTVDYKGVRYPFSSAEDKAEFQKDPAKFAAVPEKEALYCPVGKEAVAAPSKASSYVDHKGVRYFMCCAGCEKDFAKTPDTFADRSTSYIKDRQVVPTPPNKKSGG